MSLFPLPHTVKLFILQLSTGTQNDVTRHKNSMNFPAKGNGVQIHFSLFIVTSVSSFHELNSDVCKRTQELQMVFKWELRTCDSNGEAPVL